MKDRGRRALDGDRFTELAHKLWVPHHRGETPWLKRGLPRPYLWNGICLLRLPPHLERRKERLGGPGSGGVSPPGNGKLPKAGEGNESLKVSRPRRNQGLHYFAEDNQ